MVSTTTPRGCVPVREVVISVHCDLCNQQFYETTEGSNSVGLTVYGEAKEMDVCDPCIHGSFLQEARHVDGRRGKAKTPHACHCGKSFASPRGLSAHQTRQAHD